MHEVPMVLGHDRSKRHTFKLLQSHRYFDYCFSLYVTAQRKFIVNTNTVCLDLFRRQREACGLDMCFCQYFQDDFCYLEAISRMVFCFLVWFFFFLVSMSSAHYCLHNNQGQFFSFLILILLDSLE